MTDAAPTKVRRPRKPKAVPEPAPVVRKRARRAPRASPDPLDAYPVWYRALVPRLGLRAYTTRHLDAGLRLASVIREAQHDERAAAEALRLRVETLQAQLEDLTVVLEGMHGALRGIQQAVQYGAPGPSAPPPPGAYAPSEVPARGTAPVAVPQGKVRLLREADGTLTRLPPPESHVIDERKLAGAVRRATRRLGSGLAPLIEDGVRNLRRRVAAGEQISRSYDDFLGGYVDARLARLDRQEEDGFNGEDMEPDDADDAEEPPEAGPPEPQPPAAAPDPLVAAVTEEWRPAQTPEQEG